MKIKFVLRDVYAVAMMNYNKQHIKVLVLRPVIYTTDCNFSFLH
jgi:hypothetical protein